MVDLLFPPHACISAQRVDVVSNTASARSVFTGATRTVDRTGDRFRWTITRSNASDRNGYEERTTLKAFRARMRGQANRVWFSDPAYQQRGSFPASELFENSTFADGILGWTSSKDSLSVSDRVMRITATSPAATVEFYRNASLTPFAPYVMRSVIYDGAQTAGLSIGPALSLGLYQVTSYSSARGLIRVSGVSNPTSSQAHFPVVFASTSGFTSGAYVECPYVSISRCALIDNGPNLLLQSDEFSLSWAPERATIGTNAATAPDGSGTADALIEDNTTGNHNVWQAAIVLSAAADYSVSVAVKAQGRNFVRLHMAHAGGDVLQVFNLSTGAVGSTSAAGTDWSQPRAAIAPMGNGWYKCSLTARKTGSQTSIETFIMAQNADSAATYAGNSSTALYLWRGTSAQSSVPTRLVQTTSAATSGASQTGTGIHLKGLPAGASGLLLPGDRVQIGNQLCEVVAPLNSDAAGLGYLQLAWPLRTAPADNAPVIINNPMARCILTSNEGGWSDTPGGFSEFDFQLEEALD